MLFLILLKLDSLVYRDKFVRVDSNGEEHHAGLPTGNKEPYIGLVNYVDSLKSKNDAVLDGGRIRRATPRQAVWLFLTDHRRG